MRTRVALTTAVATFGVMGSVGAASALATRAPNQTGVCGTAEVKPGSVSLAVDGDSFLAGYRAPGHQPYDDGARVPDMTWTSWGTNGATGTGWEWVDTDHPSVGQGTYYAFKMTVQLTRPRNGIFTRMTIDAQIPQSFDTRWHGYWKDKQTLSAVTCKGGGVGWN